MNKSFIKKIINPEEFEKAFKDVCTLGKQDEENNAHVLDLKHDTELMCSSISHESLLIWNIHVWAHFNGEKWDGIFIGFIRKSEKFNKKIMEEYLWFSKNSSKGVLLYKEAIKYAKDQKCEYIFMSTLEKHPLSNKIKKFYLKNNFEKDSEVYIKKL
jgi:hypothetical protein